MTDSALWLGRDVIAATGGQAIGGSEWAGHGISIDTRSLEPGDIFFALVGENADGHGYVKTAFEKGAAAAIVSRDLDDAQGPLVRVADVRQALTDLGLAARARSHAKIIAVTGSVGKTSTKEALKLALGRGQATHASAASFNNDLGVPVSLARMPADSEFGVFEVGMNHAGELTALSKMVRPDVALITNVEQAHSAFFPSVEAIADAKAEVFIGLEGDAVAILNRDNAHFDRLQAAAQAAGAKRIVTFGLERGDAYTLRQALHEECSCVTADILGERITYKVGAPGKHWVLNSLAVLLATKIMGGDLGLAGLALADMMPVKGRGLRHKVALGNHAFWVVDESYNANPASMRAAIDTLGAINLDPVAGQRRRGRRVAVLGDMRELGDAGPKLHAGLAKVIADADITKVLTVGELMQNLADALPKDVHLAHADTAEAAADIMRTAVEPNDVIMVKGSLSMGMVKVVNALLNLGTAKASQVVNG